MNRYWNLKQVGDEVVHKASTIHEACMRHQRVMCLFCLAKAEKSDNP